MGGKGKRFVLCGWISATLDGRISLTYAMVVMLAQLQLRCSLSEIGGWIAEDRGMD